MYDLLDFNCNDDLRVKYSIYVLLYMRDTQSQKYLVAFR